MTESTRHATVTEQDTAQALGSGSLPVLGTPRLLAWCEAATCDALEGSLGDSETSVGTRVVLDHRAPSPLGAGLAVTAVLTGSEGRRRFFEVSAVHTGDGRLVATAEITRAVVDAARFLDGPH